MTTTQTAAPWWRTAPNPECRPWCTDDHHEDEFKAGGTLGCTQTIEIVAGFFAIEVCQLTTVLDGDHPPVGVTELTSPKLWEHCEREFTECTLDEVEQYARAILRGVEVAREIEAQG